MNISHVVACCQTGTCGCACHNDVNHVLRGLLEVIAQCTTHALSALPVGSVVRTTHGSRLRKFDRGWSPLDGAHWDLWTVYSDHEVAHNFTVEAVESQQ